MGMSGSTEGHASQPCTGSWVGPTFVAGSNALRNAAGRFAGGAPGVTPRLLLHELRQLLINIPLLRWHCLLLHSCSCCVVVLPLLLLLLLQAAVGATWLLYAKVDAQGHPCCCHQSRQGVLHGALSNRLLHLPGLLLQPWYLLLGAAVLEPALT